MKHVLIVDDKEENIYYLRALLAGHGWAVETARHGAEALVKARLAAPDLIVADLLMPVMDGYTLLRHWKSDTRLKAAPFVVYTATYTEAEDEELALSLGADAFILKPAEPEAFMARIAAVLAGGDAAVPRAPAGDEKEMLRVYSQTLIRKLEEKTLQLEEANRALQADVTERKGAQERLRESEERFRATFEQVAVGIAHVGVDGTFLRVNDKLCEITGHSREELLRRTFLELTAPEDRAESDEARRAILAGTRAVYSAEKRYVRANGTTFWAAVVTSLLRDAAGEPKYFITVVADITERRTLQEQFLRAQRLESIGTLAGGIAHDMNNLLAPIMMGVGLLSQKKLDAEDRKIVETIERSVQRGTELVKQVLSFARGVEGARVAVHLAHVVREIEGIVRTTFPKNIAFRADLPKDTWLVQGDPTQLNQVILNLCVNARDAMPQGGTLRVTAANATVDEQFAAMHRAVSPGRYVLLEVIDSGTGIPADVADRIFEPFFTTKAHGKGTGLGLSTVQGIVRSHGGCVNVHSELGRGTTFQVYLPALEESGERGVAPPRNEALPRGNGELILVVDDEASILTITRQTLQTFGYRVITAEDGAHAIGLYAQNAREVAAVFTDMMMPVMDGPALIAALKRIDPGVRIVASSGLDARDRVAKAAGAGVKHFLAKPYTAEAILLTLHQVLAEPSEPVG